MDTAKCTSGGVEHTYTAIEVDTNTKHQLNGQGHPFHTETHRQWAIFCIRCGATKALELGLDKLPE